MSIDGQIRQGEQELNIRQINDLFKSVREGRHIGWRRVQMSFIVISDDERQQYLRRGNFKSPRGEMDTGVGPLESCTHYLTRVTPSRPSQKTRIPHYCLQSIAMACNEGQAR